MKGTTTNTSAAMAAGMPLLHTFQGAPFASNGFQNGFQYTASGPFVIITTSNNPNGVGPVSQSMTINGNFSAAPFNVPTESQGMGGPRQPNSLQNSGQGVLGGSPALLNYITTANSGTNQNINDGIPSQGAFSNGMMTLAAFNALQTTSLQPSVKQQQRLTLQSSFKKPARSSAKGPGPGYGAPQVSTGLGGGFNTLQIAGNNNSQTRPHHQNSTDRKLIGVSITGNALTVKSTNKHQQQSQLRQYRKMQSEDPPSIQNQLRQPSPLGIVPQQQKKIHPSMLYVSTLVNQNSFLQRQSKEIQPTIDNINGLPFQQQMNDSPSDTLINNVKVAPQLMSPQMYAITTQNMVNSQPQAPVSATSQEPSPKQHSFKSSGLKYMHTSVLSKTAQAQVVQQSKLDNILSSHQILPGMNINQPQQQSGTNHRKRESMNSSQQSVHSSSKKHREFMKAQELSKVLVQTTSANISDSQNFTQASTNDERLLTHSIPFNTRSLSRDPSDTEEMNHLEISGEILGNGGALNQVHKLNFDAQGTGKLFKRNSNQFQNSSASSSLKGGMLMQQLSMNPSNVENAMGNGLQRAGSASNSSQQMTNMNKQIMRRGSEKTQRRRENQGVVVNSGGQVQQQLSQGKLPLIVTSAVAAEIKEKTPERQLLISGVSSQQKPQSSQTLINQSQGAIQQDQQMITISSIQPQANQQASHTPISNRSHSFEMNKDLSKELLDEDYGATSKSTINTNTVVSQQNNHNGAACGCDSLSQVSEESAFDEEDDCENGIGGPTKGDTEPANKAAAKKPTEDKINVEDDNKKKKQVTIKILASMPNNAKEQEDAFFESGFTLNPVFEYDNPMVASRFISQFKKPRSDLMPIATKILDAFLAEYGSESNYLLTEGRVITDQNETEQIFQNYLEAHHILDIAQINFSDKIVAPTSVTYDNYSSKIRINIQVPIEYREGRITGVLHHEIGTHFLRRYNEVLQPWHQKRKKFGLKSCIAIEEGMGCIHMMLEQASDCASFVLDGAPKQPDIEDKTQTGSDEAPKIFRRMPYLFKPALNYYACYKASEMSFSELFADLARYVDNPKKRWKYVLRVKRGLSDTSQPGGLYKDQVYLEGAVKILKNRKNIDFKMLYCGKINIEDLKRPKFIKKAQLDSIITPLFMEDLKEYKRNLEVIARLNFID